jgi:hypothetical protein
MNRRLRLLALALGLVLFGFVLYRVGLHNLIDNFRRAGWVLAPIMLLWLGTYCCNATSWRLIMADEPGRPGFGEALQTTISGFALNYATPVLSVGGEALKAAAATRWLGSARRGAGAVVGYRLLFTTAHVLCMLTAVGIAVLHGPTTPVARWGLGLAAVILLLEVALLLSIHRAGALLQLLALLHRIPGLGRLATKAEAKREALGELDQVVTALWRTRPIRFWAALGLEVLGRSLMFGEFYLVPRSLGLAVTPWDGFAMGGLTSLVGLMLFVVPFGLGAKEAGSLGAFRLLGYDPAIGVYTAVVGRVRELCWIGIGLLLLAVKPRVVGR